MNETISPNSTIAQYTIVSKIGKAAWARCGAHAVFQYGLFQEFDVTLDRQKFVIGMLIGEPKSANPRVILNWPALMKK